VLIAYQLGHDAVSLASEFTVRRSRITARVPRASSRKPYRPMDNGAMTDHSEGVLDPAIAGRLKRTADGLVPAIAQQHDTGEVLMLAWMDDEALHRTLTTGRATYWSRSRQEYWVKGETSGHRQWVRDVRLDCDGDALLVLVDQEGPACHTGERSCFHRELAA
jgi:phosphoribosyl-AMP cyclohydrolase